MYKFLIQYIAILLTFLSCSRSADQVWVFFLQMLTCSCPEAISWHISSANQISVHHNAQKYPLPPISGLPLRDTQQNISSHLSTNPLGKWSPVSLDRSIFRKCVKLLYIFTLLYFCRYIFTNKVTLWAASYLACVVCTKTIIHLSVGESGGYLPCCFAARQISTTIHLHFNE